MVVVNIRSFVFSAFPDAHFLRKASKQIDPWYKRTYALEALPLLSKKEKEAEKEGKTAVFFGTHASVCRQQRARMSNLKDSDKSEERNTK